MPTYEYACDACGHLFEQWQTMSEPAIRKCPKCRKPKVRRLISGGAGVIFKGSGFYETDYKRNRPGAKSDSSGGDAPAKDASPGSAKDSAKDATKSATSAAPKDGGAPKAKDSGAKKPKPSR